MNKKKLRNYQIFSIVFTFALGSLLHFTYELSGQNQFVAMFSAINESVWEHLKLVFFPMFITAIIGYFYLKNTFPNYLCSKTIGILSAMAFLVIFFYTYSGIIGKNIAIVDISSFFIATILGETITYLLAINNFKCNNIISIFILLFILISFLIFTYSPPKIGIFKDPLTETYGITRQK